MEILCGFYGDGYGRKKPAREGPALAIRMSLRWAEKALQVLRKLSRYQGTAGLRCAGGAGSSAAHRQPGKRTTAATPSPVLETVQEAPCRSKIIFTK